MSARLPDPSPTRVFRLEATVGEPLDLGDLAQGRRRIVPLTGGTFTGPDLNGKLLPGSSADWQTVLPDGTALGDIRYTLETDEGDLLYVQSRSMRHGSADVLARLARGEDVDASEYTFRTSTKIETAAIAVAAHPGLANTELTRHTPAIANALISQTAAMGALPILRAATDPGVLGGQYYGPGRFFGTRGYPKPAHSSGQSRDTAIQRRLWTVSEELTGVTFPV